jgi:hypothetical protein
MEPSIVTDLVTQGVLKSDYVGMIILTVSLWRLLPTLMAISTNLGELRLTIHHGFASLGLRLDKLEDRVSHTELMLNQR